MKTVLITGSAKRIGREIAHSLARQGWGIAVHYHHSKEEAVTLEHELLTHHVPVMTVAADLMKEADVLSLIPTVTKALGPLTCLINNASSFTNDTLQTSSRPLWESHMEVNLRAPVILMQQFATQLPEALKGNIINMLDYSVMTVPDSFFSYNISKSALWSATQMLALQLAPMIRVNAIGPGHVLPSPRQSAASFTKMCENSPLKHGSSPEEICRAIDFILTSPSLTGQMIALDSGLHLVGSSYS